jgi:hypothetical protein
MHEMIDQVLGKNEICARWDAGRYIKKIKPVRRKTLSVFRYQAGHYIEPAILQFSMDPKNVRYPIEVAAWQIDDRFDAVGSNDMIQSVQGLLNRR